MKSASLPQGFFLGQIPPNWNEYVRASSWQDAHNNRVKVRIPGKHSKSGEIPDKDLPWAIVEQSTSSGNLNGSSVGLWGGEWVTGYFLDKDEQIPVITGVLGVNTIEDEKLDASIGGSTQFKPVKRFNGFVAKLYQMRGGSKPKESAGMDKETIKKATKGMGEGSKSDAELQEMFNNPNMRRSDPEELEREQLARIRSLPEPTGDVIDLSDTEPETRTLAQIQADSAAREQRIINQIGEEEYYRRQRERLNR